MIAKEINDPEFGIIPIKRVAYSKHVRVRVAADGQLKATMPRLAPIFLLRQLIDNSRLELRKAVTINPSKSRQYFDGDNIGASHKIFLKRTSPSQAKIKDQSILWQVPEGEDESSKTHQDIVRKAVRKALDKESKAYLPRRLSYLATNGGFSYNSIRFSNAKGRWGSCSNHKVISLNVALMNLPKEIIDYVITHELSHTVHLNHSKEFWLLVQQNYPDFKQARKDLKTFNPYL